MEVYERIKELRKNTLKMSQTAFGERLGVSRSVIHNIELNVLARPEQKMSLYKLICSEFNISEEWLLHGTGEMYDNNEAEYNALIDRVMSGENAFAKNIFKTFAKFDEKDWEGLQHMIETYLSVSSENGKLHEDHEEPKHSEPLNYDYIEKKYPPTAAELLAKYPDDSEKKGKGTYNNAV